MKKVFTLKKLFAFAVVSCFFWGCSVTSEVTPPPKENSQTGGGSDGNGSSVDDENTGGNSSESGGSSSSQGSGSESEQVILVTNIEITGPETVAAGGTANYYVSVLPSNASNKAVLWKIEGMEGAVISNSGVLTIPDTTGTLRVSASSVDGSNVTASKEVTVIDVSSVQGSINITETGGWLEAAFVEWSPVDEFDGYNVYVKSLSSSEWTKLDSQLVRFYSDTAASSVISYCRADALGLKPDSYQFKVIGTVSGIEAEQSASESAAVSVSAQDRSGFAFTDEKSPGAYNDDGTLKAGTKVIYVSSENAKSVSLTYTNSKGAETTVTGLQNIIGEGNTKNYSFPVCVRILGKISKEDVDYNSSGWNSSEGLSVKNNCKSAYVPITIEGVGEDAVIHGFGIHARDSKYLEIKNLAIMNFMDDAISLDTSNLYTWVHNVDFFYGATGSDADQKKGDGSLDVKGDSMYQTYSYNHFWDSGKASLCGMTSESGPNYITYHHNWFDHSDSRHPRIRTMTVHIYNNYYDGNSKYGVGATTGSNAFVEGNYFRNVKYPVLISLQGNDLYAGSATSNSENGTFSSEAGGMIKMYDNYIEGSLTSYWPYMGTGTNWTKGSAAVPAGVDTAIHFDAYEVSSRSEIVPSSVKTLSGGNAYSNFDTEMGDSGLGLVNLPTDPVTARDTVKKYAGRMNGGDFTWEFTESADSSSDVDEALKNAVVNYESKLVKVQDIEKGQAGDTGTGGSSSSGESESGNTENSGSTESGSAGAAVEITGGITHSFAESGLTSDYFLITGNTSNDAKYGTATLNGVTSSISLKMESATSISFTLEKEMTLTLVFGINGTNGSAASGTKTVKIDGTKHTIGADGIFSVSLAAGNHVIAKGDSVNLFFIVLSE